MDFFKKKPEQKPKEFSQLKASPSALVFHIQETMYEASRTVGTLRWMGYSNVPKVKAVETAVEAALNASRELVKTLDPIHSSTPQEAKEEIK